MDETRVTELAELVGRAFETERLSDLFTREAEEQARVLREGLSDHPSPEAVHFVLGWFHWGRYLELPEGADQEALQTAAQDLSTCFLSVDDLDSLPEPLIPLLAEMSIPRAFRLMQEAMEATTAEPFDAALRAWERITRLTPGEHPTAPGRLSNLGMLLATRFQRLGDFDDLDRAIAAHLDALALIPAGTAVPALFQSNLCASLRLRFEHIGDPDDLDRAITHGRQAVESASTEDPDRADYLTNLGSALHTRFQRTGDLDDLHQAIAHGRQAVESASTEDPDRALYLSNLCAAVLSRFERTGDLADLDQAITHGRQAVQTTPSEDHPNHAARLSNLGIALHTRFEYTGDPRDLDQAITHGRHAVETSLIGDPDRTDYLSNLAAALHTRFERTGDLDDLDRAVTTYRHTLEVIPAAHPGRRVLWFNLGSALQARSERTDDPDDLDEAIAAYHDALTGFPGRPRRGDARLRSNLGTALRVRFERSGNPEDLRQAIAHGQEAVDALPPDDPDRAGRLSNLGNALLLLFRRAGDPDALDRAIACGREAVGRFPGPHPKRAFHLSNLGIALGTRYRLRGDLEDSEASAAVFEECRTMPSIDPATRVRAARSLANLVGDRSPDRAATALREAVAFLPLVADRALRRRDRQYNLGQFFGLAAQAAAMTLVSGTGTPAERAALALNILEAGRGVLSGQVLDTRDDLARLRREHPGPAERFTSLVDLLDHMESGFPERPPGTVGPRSDTARGGTVSRERIVREFSEALEEIRSLEGFSSFALPPTAEDLTADAEQGPVVVFNTVDERCDALVLTTSGVRCVPLGGLTLSELIAQTGKFHSALDKALDRKEDTPDSTREEGQKEVSEVLVWLWEVAVGPVLEELGFDREPEDGAWPRVWWVPGGLLGLLPLHAAGHHDGTGQAAMDRVVSSYAPTVRSLRHSREKERTRRRSTGTPPGSLTVAMPVTDPEQASTWGPLRHAMDEMEAVLAHLPTSDVLCSGTTDVPTRATVMNRLSRARTAHFICHGDSHPTDPSSSFLLLHGHAQNPFTVADLAPIQLEQAELAYLSACNTAAVDTPELLDEGIHVASAFQLAGFPHVIGTLWAAQDRLSVRVADLFYEHLRGPDGALDTSRSAHALHMAVRKVRDGDGLPRRMLRHGRTRADVPVFWSTYLHTGA
ncbi:CHAT domain-containing tetratricopeptide repeat protein [Nocardiopsis protaetiae]|uniref:CHAT domain-containing tetratricopeptide repeat protein n=1 Tax=Nocardiopsis protaetiae TaxID=3382270 RepID=UPI00387B6651